LFSYDLLVIKQKKLELQNALPDQTLKETTIIFVKIRKKKKGKRLKEWEVVVGVKAREKKIEREWKILYISSTYATYIY